MHACKKENADTKASHLTECGSTYNGGHEQEHSLREIDELALAGSGTNIGQKTMDFILPNGAKGTDIFAVEELHHAYLPHLSPVITVRTKRNVGTIVEDYFVGNQLRLSRESEVAHDALRAPVSLCQLSKNAVGGQYRI
nr:hypothetical protein B296_00008671 [Ipomoea trifida]